MNFNAVLLTTPLLYLAWSGFREIRGSWVRSLGWILLYFKLYEYDDVRGMELKKCLAMSKMSED